MTTDERSLLAAFLGNQRQAVLAIVDDLPEESLRRPVLPSGWTPIGMVRHLTDNERYWFRQNAAGETVDFPWDDADDPDAEFKVGPDESVAAVIALYRSEALRADAALAGLSLDEEPRWPEVDRTRVVNVRWIVLHMIEETARHAGHLDAARELLDGVTGLGR